MAEEGPEIKAIDKGECCWSMAPPLSVIDVFVARLSCTTGNERLGCLMVML